MTSGQISLDPITVLDADCSNSQPHSSMPARLHTKRANLANLLRKSTASCLLGGVCLGVLSWLSVSQAAEPDPPANASPQGVADDGARFRMPEYPDQLPPPLRLHAEVERVLAPAAAEAAGQKPAELAADDSANRPLRIVLVAGPKDHGRGEHDYPAWQKVWAPWLQQADHTEVATAWEFPTAEQVAWADVLVFYQRGAWDAARAAVIDPFLARGGGLVYIHWAVDGRGGERAMSERIGLAALGGQIRYRHGDLDIEFAANDSHPIARNFQRVRWTDESYWALTGDTARIRTLGTSLEEGAAQPQFWTCEPGKGRVFVSILGHYMWTFDDPLYRILLLRGIAWTGRRDVDRFNDLVTLGARMADDTPINSPVEAR